MSISEVFTNSSRVGSLTGNATQLKSYIPSQLKITIFSIILIIGFLGNTIVVIVVQKQHRMQSFTNWLIINLAVADLAVCLICIPLEIGVDIHGKWIYGKFLCKVYYPIGSAAINCSLFTLVALSCSRYWAIIHPFKRQPSVLLAKVIMLLIWTSSVILTIPFMSVLTYNSEFERCYESWSRDSDSHIYTISIFILAYILPLLLITIAYAVVVYEIVMKKRSTETLEDQGKLRDNKRLIKLSLIITVTFAICALPNNVVWLLFEFEYYKHLEYFRDIATSAQSVMFLNSALNPVIYNYFSSNFREAFKDLGKLFVRHLTKDNRVFRIDSSASTNCSVFSQIQRKSRRLTLASLFEQGQVCLVIQDEMTTL